MALLKNGDNFIAASQMRIVKSLCVLLRLLTLLTLCLVLVLKYQAIFLIQNPYAGNYFTYVVFFFFSDYALQG